MRLTRRLRAVLSATTAKRPAPVQPRDDSGVLLGMAILAMVILTIASVGAVLVIAVDWRATLNRDSAAKAATAAVSAEYLVDGLITAVGPEEARQQLTQPLSPPDPLNPNAREAVWRPVTGEAACIAQGCWTATFECKVESAALLGLQTVVAGADCDNLTHGSEMPIWTVTITAAARCDPDPVDATLAAARDACRAVAPPVELIYEPVSLPLYSTVLGDGHIAPHRIDDPSDPDFSPVYAAVKSELGDGWESLTLVEGASGEFLNDPVAISSSQTGMFVNTKELGDICNTGFAGRVSEHDPDAAQNLATAGGGAGCVVTPWGGTGAIELPNGVGELLSASDLQQRACTATPYVVEWATTGLVDWGTVPPVLPRPGNRLGVMVRTVDVGTAGTDELHTFLDGTHPLLAAANPNNPVRAVIATGNVYIHDNIDASLPRRDLDGDGTPDDVVVIISGCHVFIVNDGLHNYDTRRLEHVVIVAAGGLWASHLDPRHPDYVADYQGGKLNGGSDPAGIDLPTLRIDGSVVTGWAGQVTLTGYAAGDEIAIAGFAPCFFNAGSGCADRELPPGWAAASTQFWPGREHGSWRQR